MSTRRPNWLTDVEDADGVPTAMRRLYVALYAVTDAYWGVTDDHAGDGGEPPSMIVEARAALKYARCG